MNKSNMNENNEHKGINIFINGNPLDSKSAEIVIKKKSYMDAFGEVMNEATSGCKFNIEDLWLYAAAFEVLAKNFKTVMERDTPEQLKVYHDFLKCLTSISL